jgi:hypothetical protein
MHKGETIIDLEKLVEKYSLDSKERTGLQKGCLNAALEVLEYLKPDDHTPRLTANIIAAMIYRNIREGKEL